MDNWTSWSPWQWNEQYHTHACYRMNTTTGEYEWQYHQSQNQNQQPQGIQPNARHSVDSGFHGSPQAPSANESTDRTPQPQWTPIALTYGGSTSGQPLQRGESSLGSPLPSVQSTQYTQSLQVPNIIQTITPQENLRSKNVDKEHELKKARPEYFQPGVVFTCLWTEPAGDANRADMRYAFSIVGRDHNIFTERRRFIVIRRQTEYHSTCVPIATYKFRGTADRYDREWHSVVYTSWQGDPGQMNGENLNNAAIPVDVIDNQELHPASRINFSKTYTVEHNVRVKKLGVVQGPHMPYLLQYWRQASGLA